MQHVDMKHDPYTYFCISSMISFKVLDGCLNYSDSLHADGSYKCRNALYEAEVPPLIAAKSSKA